MFDRVAITVKFTSCREFVKTSMLDVVSLVILIVTFDLSGHEVELSCMLRRYIVHAAARS